MTAPKSRPLLNRRQCLFLILGLAGIIALIGVLIAVVMTHEDESEELPVSIVTNTAPPPSAVITATDFLSATPVPTVANFSSTIPATSAVRVGDDAATFAAQRGTFTPTPVPPTETLIPSATSAPTLTFQPELFLCPGAPSPRLLVNGMGMITAQAGARLYESADPTSFVIRPLQFETTFTIVRGPRCVDNRPWWQVRLEDGTLGWLAEVENGEYVVIGMLAPQ